MLLRALGQKTDHGFFHGHGEQQKGHRFGVALAQHLIQRINHVHDQTIAQIAHRAESQGPGRIGAAHQRDLRRAERCGLCRGHQ